MVMGVIHKPGNCVMLFFLRPAPKPAAEAEAVAAGPAGRFNEPFSKCPFDRGGTEDASHGFALKAQHSHRYAASWIELLSTSAATFCSMVGMAMTIRCQYWQIFTANNTLQMTD